MFKLFLTSLFLLISATTHAEYFYFWADGYTASIDADGSMYVSTHVKSSDLSTYSFTLDGKEFAKDVTVFPNEVVDFPVVVSNKHVLGKKEVTLCALKDASNVNFRQQVCLSIKVY